MVLFGFYLFTLTSSVGVEITIFYEEIFLSLVAWDTRSDKDTVAIVLKFFIVGGGRALASIRIGFH